MKTVLLIICAFPLLILQNGSCADKDVLEHELPPEQYALLNEQPECIKQKLVEHYKQGGKTEDVNMVKAEVRGETIYYLGGVGKQVWEIVTNDCQRFRGRLSSRDFEKKQVLIGDSDMIPPPPPIKANKPEKIEPSDDFNLQEEMSDCIKEKIELFVKEGNHLSLAQIYSFTSQDETYYLFDHGRAVDGPAYVLDNQCDTICMAGGMRRGMDSNANPCPKENPKSQQIIWMKDSQ